MVPLLKKIYLILLAPVVATLLLLLILQRGFLIHAIPLFHAPLWLSPVVFMAATLTALALPILMRTLFAKRTARSGAVAPDTFLRFQKRLLFVSMVTPYLGLLAPLLALQKFYASATLLMSLYAVYYYFPSQRRIHFDKRIFRVR